MKKKVTRLIIIIDGSNFYYKLKSLDIKETFKFAYDDWVKSLTDNSKLVNQYY